MDDQDDMVRRAEREVLAAAENWVRSQYGKQESSTEEEQRLRVAVILLQKTRRATGRIKVQE